MSRYYSPEGGFYNLDKTPDLEFYCFKCFVIRRLRSELLNPAKKQLFCD